ncbi:MAG: hypothetical protein AVDCRST_MAG05-358, partial [uncultured Rubrobacteraceae bacterium]
AARNEDARRLPGPGGERPRRTGRRRPLRRRDLGRALPGRRHRRPAAGGAGPDAPRLCRGCQRGHARERRCGPHPRAGLGEPARRGRPSRLRPARGGLLRLPCQRTLLGYRRAGLPAVRRPGGRQGGRGRSAPQERQGGARLRGSGCGPRDRARGGTRLRRPGLVGPVPHRRHTRLAAGREGARRRRLGLRHQLVRGGGLGRPRGRGDPHRAGLEPGYRYRPPLRDRTARPLRPDAVLGPAARLFEHEGGL